MSPVRGEATDLFAWFGIIMYRHGEVDGPYNKEIHKRFERYRDLCRVHLWSPYDAREHWAKIEPSASRTSRLEQYSTLKRLYPLDEFKKACVEVDRFQMFASPLLDTLDMHSNVNATSCPAFRSKL